MHSQSIHGRSEGYKRSLATPLPPPPSSNRLILLMGSIKPLFATILLALSGHAHATFYTDASQLPTTEYDFVVVGGTSYRSVLSFLSG